MSRIEQRRLPGIGPGRRSTASAKSGGARKGYGDPDHGKALRRGETAPGDRSVASGIRPQLSSVLLLLQLYLLPLGRPHAIKPTRMGARARTRPHVPCVLAAPGSRDSDNRFSGANRSIEVCACVSGWVCMSLSTCLCICLRLSASGSVCLHLPVWVCICLRLSVSACICLCRLSPANVWVLLPMSVNVGTAGLALQVAWRRQPESHRRFEGVRTQLPSVTTAAILMSPSMRRRQRVLVRAYCTRRCTQATSHGVAGVMLPDTHNEQLNFVSFRGRANWSISNRNESMWGLGRRRAVARSCGRSCGRAVAHGRVDGRPGGRTAARPVGRAAAHGSEKRSAVPVR